MEIDKPSIYLEFDKQIWNVFLIGVVSSVIILYYFYVSALSNNLKSDMLMLGFSILIYSFLSILGYAHKKERYGDKKMSNEYYTRTRWMGESILVLIIIYYFISFFISLSNIIIPLIISIIAEITCLIANSKEFRKKK